MTDIFSAKAPKVMADLMRDFSLSVEDAAAILGNIGHECEGFKTLQEKKPVVPGSRGGYGWCQWTASRRKAYEAWCNRKDFDPASDEANYSFLYRELMGYEGEPALKAINAVKAAKTLQDKVTAFEKAFLRAGVKHYDSRVQWAEKALKAWRANKRVIEAPVAPAQVNVLIGALIAAIVALASYLGVDAETIKSMIP